VVSDGKTRKFTKVYFVVDIFPEEFERASKLKNLSIPEAQRLKKRKAGR